MASVRFVLLFILLGIPTSGTTELDEFGADEPSGGDRRAERPVPEGTDPAELLLWPDR